MAYIKTKQETQLILEGGKILGKILAELGKMAQPGVSAFTIDQKAEELIKAAGGRPAFKGYKNHRHDPPFPSTICACINEELVHGIATKEKVLKEGDIFTIDIGMEYPVYAKASPGKKGYFTDTALTVPVGKIPEKVQKLLADTQKSLSLAIKACKVKNTVADIGKAVEDYISPKGYGIVRDLVGHGVGHAVHEDPRVPNYYSPENKKWVLEEGVVIAIEPMITLGTHEIMTANDGWSISTVDNSLCAHFEHTIIITKKGPVIATLRPGEKKL
ncbi:MAG: Methionine aminopeptidase [Candidatus Magasanikbacteria bacterium GW2011_GWC2_37_14]|uniref:Methionine aminopeptidase n=1 Tax=Candidatus Magasanikbacteria bacterium GW2011_GWC2_37_14 TaxID=1619046 RepID=A0A0G0GB13_9BACT|nr:MAG: Methionine aminopeptidase [Candidatus Magasanikbacteria bacterium GW2011_GWC2_37_14]